MTRQVLSRRTLLRGVGVSMALPWLESLPMWGDEPASERRPGAQTKIPSLVLACEPANPSVHKNYSMIYSSHISWSSPTTPTPLELYPALAFDQLFRDEARLGDRSVLDAVLADASDFRRQI